MTVNEHQVKLEKLLRAAPIIPVVTIDDVASAVPLAKALVRGGLPVIEITLRSAAAMDCIKAIIAEVKDAIVGAGTVLSPRQLEQCEKLGCAFAVSPGSTRQLLNAAKDGSLPLLPGAATASEIMDLLEQGYLFQKFFPAEASGGVAALSAFAAPLSNVQFCPTGGITPANARDYLRLPNVITLGGSWMVSKTLIENRDWNGIITQAQSAALIRST